MAALALVPLIAIAWADGSIDDKERVAVFAGPGGGRVTGRCQS